MRKFKQVLALACAAIMMFSFAACKTTSNSGSGASTTAGGEMKAMPAIAKDKVKVGVIHIGDPSATSGYTYAHDKGIQAMQSSLGLADSQIVRVNNVSDGDSSAVENAINQLIEAGCNMIFGTSWGYMDKMESAATAHPDIIFSHCSGNKSNATNFNNYFGRIYQARYLAGIAAGLKTKSNKIGYVGAMNNENAEVTGGIDAFALGVASVNKDAKVYVKVTNTWFDPTIEKSAAEALLNQGCDVIAQHQDTAGPQIAAQEKGVWGIGYNSDMSKEAPKAVLTSVEWNWGVYYTQAVKQAIEGKWTPANYFGGMDDGLITVPALTSLCADGTQAKVDEAAAKLKDGSLKVFAGEIKDNQGNVKVKAGEALTDKQIAQEINWYVSNVVSA